MKTKPLILFFIIVISAGVLIAFYPAFKSGFTNWDDPAYVTNNELIKSFDSGKFAEIFSTYRNGHYHPLTWLSLAADYNLGNGEPAYFHATSIIIHLLNTFLLFFFLYRILKDEWMAFIVALLFGVHPMAVESVAWVSERKTVLYAFFFLISLLFYIKYSERNKIIHYILCIAFFTLSCFSKSMAVVLPLVLVAIDYFKGKNIFSFKTYINKLPFFAISVVFGLISVFAQQDVMQYEHDQEFSYNLGWGAWSFLLYLIKILIPFNLSAFYSYPPDGSIDTYKTVLGAVAIIAFIFSLVYFYRKANRPVVFGLIFIVINLFFVLKFFNIPAGAYYMADRYAYFPVVGLWLVAFSLAGNALKQRKVIVNYLFLTIAVIFMLVSVQRSKIWKNSIIMWTDVIEKHDDATIAYINRANAYRDSKKYVLAIADYDKAEKINPRYSVIYSNRGYANYMNNEFKGAVRDFSKSLSMNPTQTEVLYNRGLAFQALKEYDKALEDYTKVIEDDSLFYKAINAKGNVYYEMNNDSMAMYYYNKSIMLFPDNAQCYYNRANILAKNGKHKEALAEYTKAIEIVGYNADYIVNRANTYYYLGDFDKAMNDFNTVISKNSTNTNARINRGTLCLRMGKYQQAFDDFSEIINREPKNAEAWLKRGMTILNSHKPQDACNDFIQAEKLGHPLAMAFIKEYCN